MKIKFNSPEDEELGFDVLLGVGKRFYYVGAKALEINRDQKHTLDMRGVNYTVIEK
jgi:hypothetical protein